MNTRMIRRFGTMTIVLMMVILIPAAASLAKPYPTFHRGARPMGMGGAFTALADDENALYYNPAGLSAIQRLDLGIINPLVEVSKDSIQFLEDLNDTETGDTGAVADLLRAHIGEPQHLRAALAPYVGFRIAKVGAMIGLLGSGYFDAEIRNPAWPEANVDLVQDKAVVAGVGFKVPVTGLRLGASIKFVNRSSLEAVYSAADIADENFEDQIEDDLSEGSGFSLDIGAIYTLSFVKFIDTDVALVIQNLPEMDLGDAKDMNTQANIGLAVSKSLARFKLTGTLDYHDITMNLEEDNDFGKRLHLGLELKTPFFVSVRTGFNQGYWSAGASLDFRAVRLDFATYSEEVGAYAGQRKDQRYLGQLTIGW